MTEALDSRTQILASICGNHSPATPESAAVLIAENYASIPRHYTYADLLTVEDRINLFEERLREYDAAVYRTTSDLLPAIIDRVLTLREMRQIATPHGLPASWLLNHSLFVTEADTYSPRELDQFDGILTGCTVAIALTGTIVLQNAQAQGSRKLSLVPDYHLCIVFADQLVGTVPEAFERLAATATLPTTFISGPSATADIEMTRIKGVHGPRFLDVIFVN
jgi:L-lactate dehydrogenase complex protein LldG